MRRSALKRKTPLKATNPMRKVSKKQAKINREYTELRRQFLEDHPFCEVCGKPSNQVHHKFGRGKYTLDVSTWMAVENQCHEWIETHKREAREKGYILYK